MMVVSGGIARSNVGRAFPCLGLKRDDQIIVEQEMSSIIDSEIEACWADCGTDPNEGCDRQLMDVQKAINFKKWIYPLKHKYDNATKTSCCEYCTRDGPISGFGDEIIKEH